MLPAGKASFSLDMHRWSWGGAPGCWLGWHFNLPATVLHLYQEQNPDDWHNVEWNGAEGQELAEPQEQLGQQAAAAGQGGQGQHGPADDDDDEYFADWAQAAGQEAAGPQEQQGHGAAEEGDEAAGQEAAGPQEQEEHGAEKDDDDEEEDAAAEDNGDDVLFAQFAAWAQSEIQEEAEPEEEEEQGAAAADGGIDAAAGAVALWLNQVGPEVNQQLVAAAWHVASPCILLGVPAVSPPVGVGLRGPAAVTVRSWMLGPCRA